MRCEVCPHHCDIPEGKRGLCRARANIGGKITCVNYGKLTAISLDPIEKKPLARFCPGSKILSVGSFGCNLRCPFCQNSEISMAGESIETVYVSPEALVKKAEEIRGNIGLAFTYNEPLIGYEYVRDCGALAREKGLKMVLVTNGTICRGPLTELLPCIDAMNIDLKGFTERFYHMVGGDLETVKRTIELAVKSCHVEVTVLTIPGENDGPEEMEALSGWLAGVDPEIPLHITRCFPRYKMSGKSPTPIETLMRLRDVASRHMRYVYLGNC